jgi:hypothetical protein
MALPDLKLHRESAAVYRLVESMWWGQPCERLEIATLHPRYPSSGWLVFALPFLLLLLGRGC